MLVLTKRALRYILDSYIYNAGRRLSQGLFELLVHLAFDLNSDPGIGGRSARMSCHMLVKL